MDLENGKAQLTAHWWTKESCNNITNLGFQCFSFSNIIGPISDYWALLMLMVELRGTFTLVSFYFMITRGWPARI